MSAAVKRARADARFADAVERVLTYLSLSDKSLEYCGVNEYGDEPPPAWQKRYMILPDLTYFDGALPFLPEELPNLTAHERVFLNPNPATGGFVDPVELCRALPSDIDVGVLVDPTKMAGDGGTCSWARKINKTPVYDLMRVRRLDLRELRPYGLELRSGLAFELGNASIFTDGSFTSCRQIVEYRGDCWWAIGQPCRIYEQPLPAGDGRACSMSLSVALTEYYDWHVDIGLPRFPAIALATDSVGAAAAFKLRALPPGRSRREALLHWVREHWRRPRDADADAEAVRVLAHMRGAERFDWHGYRCRIRPSQYDLTRLGLIEDERKTLQQMRKAKRRDRERMLRVRKRWLRGVSG